MSKVLSARKERQIKEQVANDMIRRATTVALAAKTRAMEAQRKLRDAQQQYDLARENQIEAERELDSVKRACDPARWAA